MQKMKIGFQADCRAVEQGAWKTAVKRQLDKCETLFLDSVFISICIFSESHQGIHSAKAGPMEYRQCSVAVATIICF